jgi:tetratricopeptide (TPR) repeat protein
MPIAQLEAEAWVAFAEGHSDRALDSLRRAADREAAEGEESITVPAREMLGDLLLELKRPAESLKAYQLTLDAAPNRFDALLGAARAADALGEAAQVRDYYHCSSLSQLPAPIDPKSKPPGRISEDEMT